MNASRKGFFLLVLLSSLNLVMVSEATDTINVSQPIRDGETLVSSGGRFELGFFSPGDTKNRYVGLWYKELSVKTVVWVANREDPLTSTSGVLRVIKSGILVLLNDTNGVVWSSNTTRLVQNPVAQLLGSGNLVVRDMNDDREENFLWQSFSYPTDTYLPGMKFGRNFVTGVDTYLSSWKSIHDPAPGDFTYHLDITGYPQAIVERNMTPFTRFGPYNGISLSGLPKYVDDHVYMSTFVMDRNGVYYQERTVDKSVVRRATLNPSGVVQRWTWVNRTQDWVIYLNLPTDNCDSYNICGASGICHIESSPSCRCLERFDPIDTEGWAKTDWSSGCHRRKNFTCHGDAFLKYSRLKLPDAQMTWFNESMTLKDCKEECSRNCSCTGYTQLDIRLKKGCLFWSGDLVDIRALSADGQDIYIRMASSEAESEKMEKQIVLATSTVAVGMVLLCMIFLVIRKRRNRLNPRIEVNYKKSDGSEAELPLLDISTILKATNFFSFDNKLGEGGFGPVYKGMLDEGQEVAVKRLSRNSSQGLDEFKNEVIFIAKLQHRNLVRLLGCCIHGKENMLVYEYMANRSLDLMVFDQTSAVLDWQMRFNIINGIARGIVYLHQDSHLRIIHRDLKASNILLDSDMNPKISDFGIARSFAGGEMEGKTRQVIGTYGYMSPEYAVDGIFSAKSDVFSFGVLVLEIVSGKRNRDFLHTDHHFNLLGHAWTLYRENRSFEIVDASLVDSYNLSEVLRSIHVGLLCVQQNPEDRPHMSTVVLMLGNEGVLPEVKHPGFYLERESVKSQSATNTCSTNSGTVATITMLQGR